MVIAGPRRDFSKSLVQVICFSAINYALCSPFLLLSKGLDFYNHHFWAYIVIWFLVLAVFPVILTILYLWLSLTERIDEHLIHPIERPWDWFFRQRGREHWAIVRLKDGSILGGKFGKKSFASSDPTNPEIYLEKVWRLDDKGQFLDPVDRSAGILFTGNELVSIEFFSK